MALKAQGHQRCPNRSPPLDTASDVASSSTVKIGDSHVLCCNYTKIQVLLSGSFLAITAEEETVLCSTTRGFRPAMVGWPNALVRSICGDDP